MDRAATQPAHPELQRQLLQMQQVANSISSYVPYIPKPPVLDSSADIQGTSDEGATDSGELLPGLRPLLDVVRKDIDVTQKFLEKSNAASLPAPSTNATYLVAVWEEVLRAPQPIVAIGRTFFRKNEKSKANVKKTGSRPTAGVKVDVVADNGKTWIRVNTMKNSRLLAEFREMDSYDTDSEGDLDHGGGPRAEFDNSILRMGRALISAAKDNPVVGTTVSPKIVFRLTRLDPHADPEIEGNDPRIALTIDMLRDMGIDVQLGERATDEVVRSSLGPPPSRDLHLEPTRHVNLDLSVLIALVSDLTHSSLPRSAAEAQERFVPSASYLEWKRSRLRAKIYGDRIDAEAVTDGDQDSITIENAEDMGKHSRALADQLQQEISKGLLQEMSERLSTLADHGPVEFWTTAEARDRCIRIISKIGGPNEKRRAHALFSPPDDLFEAEKAYWKDSRYPLRFLPLLPLHIFPSPEPPAPPAPITTTSNTTDQIPPRSDLSPFFGALERTSRALLGQETAPHPRALPDDLSVSEIQRASVMKANPKLTAHTVRSMLWGAANGWTTLTANRASVKAIIREVRKAGEDVGHAREGGEGGSVVEKAAIWVVDPRSLAEGMRSDFEGRFSPGLSF